VIITYNDATEIHKIERLRYARQYPSWKSWAAYRWNKRNVICGSKLSNWICEKSVYSVGAVMRRVYRIVGWT